VVVGRSLHGPGQSRDGRESSVSRRGTARAPGLLRAAGGNVAKNTADGCYVSGMRTTAVVGEPEIDGEHVIVRIAVEDPAQEDTGGLFVCRLRDYGDVSVETFPRGLTPPSEGEYRAEAAAAAIRHALENRELFDELFAQLPASR